MNEKIEEKIEEITKKIIKEFQPEKIILFGSWAWGEPTEDSDVDLLVVKATERSTRDVAREIDGALWGRTIPLDIIVYKPESIEKSINEDNFFIRDIIQNGRVLYERN